MASTTIKKRSSARRCLFPSDKKGSRSFIDTELEKIRVATEKRWGYNFDTSSPIPGSAYEYQEISVNDLPAFYGNAVVYSISPKCSNENRGPWIQPTEVSDTDTSMDCSSEEDNLKAVDVKPVLPKKRRLPKKSSLPQKRRQNTIDEMFHITRKRDQSSKSVSPTVSPQSSASVVV